jgi:hypothetical protein
MSGLGRSNLIDQSPSFSDSQDQDDSDEDIQESWIEWWTHLKGNDFLCEVAEEFLRDEFNLYGFSAQVRFLCPPLPPPHPRIGVPVFVSNIVIMNLLHCAHK